jgi:hypothetical protein
MKNYLVSLIVDNQKKVHYLVRSTSKIKAADKSLNVERKRLSMAKLVSKVKILKNENSSGI